MAGERAVSASPVLCFVFSIVTDAFSFFQSNLCFQERIVDVYKRQAYGCGIRYHYGMFKQKIQNGYQIEVPDNWLKNGYPFELRLSLIHI